MKPEHFCSGNAVQLLAGAVAVVAASMKPEHFCSGNDSNSLGDLTGWFRLQ